MKSRRTLESIDIFVGNGGEVPHGVLIPLFAS